MNNISKSLKTTARNTYRDLIAKDGFLYGMDYDWFVEYSNIGHNFGANHVIPGKTLCAFNAEKVYEDLFTIKALGFNAVNYWLFTWLDGILFDDDGNVIGLDEYFLPNLKTALNIARELGLKIILSVQSHLDDINDYSDKSMWDKYTQFLHNPVILKQYVDLCVQPVCKLVSNYQDTVMIMCLTVEGGEADVNDIDFGYISKKNFGTTWKNYRSFLIAVNQKIKEIIPDMLTSVEAVGGSIRTYKYNSIGMDLIGTNRYTKDGDVDDIEKLISTLPMYIGEFNLGTIGFESVSLDYWTKTNLKFYPSARKAGYIGAFYYSYCTGGSSFSLYNSAVSAPESLRNLAALFHYQILDDLYERQGLKDVLDTPAILANRGNGHVYWIASRTAIYYTVERSDDDGKTWSTLVANLKPNLINLNNGVCTYTDDTLTEGMNSCYRVTAYDDMGRIAISDPSNIKEFHISEKLETEVYSQKGIIAAIPESGEYKFNQTYYLKKHDLNYIEKMHQEIDVKPNTDYTLTFWYKGNTGDWQYNWSVTETLDGIDNGIVKGSLGENVSFQNWLQKKVQFNSGDNTALYLYFQTNSSLILCISDICINEVPKSKELILEAIDPANLRAVSNESNLISDNGFEAGTGNWNVDSFLNTGVLSIVENRVAHEGRKVLKFSANNLSSAVWSVFYVNVEPDTEYLFSTWVYGEYRSETNKNDMTFGIVNPSTCEFAVLSGDKFRSTTKQLFPTAWDDAWHLTGVKFYTGMSTRVGIAIYGACSTAYFDEMVLCKYSDSVAYIRKNKNDVITVTNNKPLRYICDENDNILDNYNLKFWQDGEGYGINVLAKCMNYKTCLVYKGAYFLPTHSFYIKWVNMEPNTEYTFSARYKVVQDGEGYFGLMDGNEVLPNIFAKFIFKEQQNKWITATVSFKTGVYKKIGICVCDNGGEAVIDNICLFKN